jgi:hypothetical protein
MEALQDVPRTAVNQAPGGGTDYPFTGPGDLVGAVLDFYLSYPDADCAYGLPFSLAVAGDTWTVTDADAGVVATFDAGDAVTRAWGDRTVYEWAGDDAVMRAVVQGTPAGEGVLDARTYDRLPARVTAFRVGLVRVTGNVKFEAGFNVDLSGAAPEEPADGGRYRPQLNIDAVAGAGAGRVDGCEELVPEVRKINQVGPDCAGNFKIEADPCFRVGPPLLVTGAMGEPRTAIAAAAGLTQDEAQHAVRVTSDCHPCCECDYFVRTYRGLKRQWDRWKADAAAAEAVRDTYDVNRARWLASRQCRIDNPARLVLNTDFNCKTFIGGSFCNFTTCCLAPVELRFTLRRYLGGVLQPWGGGSANEAYISGTPTDGDERYAPLVVDNVVRFFVDYADPQATTVAKMKFCTTGCTAEESLEVTLSVHVPQPPANPHTGDPCTLPAVEVPTWLADAWAGAGVPADDVRAVLTKTAALNPDQPRFDCGC